jgi:hypothetical protein
METKQPTNIDNIWREGRKAGRAKGIITQDATAAIKRDIAEGIRCRKCWSPLPCQSCEQAAPQASEESCKKS